MYSAAAVANTFLELAKREGKTLTNMQLQKLVYIAHGWMLGIVGKPLIKNTVEAWQWGPVIPDLYHPLKKFGAGIVNELLPVKQTLEAEGAPMLIVASTWAGYGQLSALQLSDITHKDGTPWSQTRQEFPGRHAVIRNELIAEHYQQLLNERQGFPIRPA